MAIESTAERRGNAFRARQIFCRGWVKIVIGSVTCKRIETGAPELLLHSQSQGKRWQGLNPEQVLLFRGSRRRG